MAASPQQVSCSALTGRQRSGRCVRGAPFETLRHGMPADGVLTFAITAPVAVLLPSSHALLINSSGPWLVAVLWLWLWLQAKALRRSAGAVLNLYLYQHDVRPPWSKSAFVTGHTVQLLWQLVWGCKQLSLLLEAMNSSAIIWLQHQLSNDTKMSQTS